MEMVNIVISNSGRYQDIALLVDQDRFLERVQKLRDILLIPLDPTTTWKMPFSKKFSSNKLKFINNYFLSDSQLLKFRDWLQDDNNFLPHLSNTTNYSFTQALEDASRKLLFEFKKTHNFLPVIKAAIATNTVNEVDYESCLFTEYAPNIADTSKIPLPDRKIYKIPQEGKWLALFFQPYTTREEIDEILDSEFQNRKTKDPMVNSAIKIHREWYWDYKKLQSYEKVGKKDKNILYSASTIWRGVAAYKKLLISQLSD